MRTSPDDAMLPARVRASFARLRQRFALCGNAAWASSLQPEHLFAYAMGDETLLDSEGASLDHAERNDQ